VLFRSIGAVERYVTEIAFENGWKPAAPAARNGRRIAVIGAGPAGLSCADFLNRAGATVTVFDRHGAIGGLLTQGVPPFKLERAALATRHALLEAAGVEFRLGVEVDGATLRRLVDDHDAVFVATGTQAPRAVSLPGRNLPGVYEALAYLKETPALAGRRVLVLGGGDTAMDCARTARRAGARVAVCARAAEESLRASPRELKAAREEGVAFHFRHYPLALVGTDGVEAVRFQTPEGETIETCDAVILAFGFVAEPPAWLAALGVDTDAHGRIRVDARGRTTHPKIYAGGDNARGPDLVVTAMADGRRAAEAILASFRLPARVAALWSRRALPTGLSNPAAVENRA
jgi:glutamate synthase (NADPH/NADH) small chain